MNLKVDPESHVPYQEALRKAVEWYRAHGYAP